MAKKSHSLTTSHTPAVLVSPIQGSNGQGKRAGSKAAISSTIPMVPVCGSCRSASRHFSSKTRTHHSNSMGITQIGKAVPSTWVWPSSVWPHCLIWTVRRQSAETEQHRFWDFSNPFNLCLIMDVDEPLTVMWAMSTFFFAPQWTGPEFTQTVVEDLQIGIGGCAQAKKLAKKKRKEAPSPKNPKQSKAAENWPTPNRAKDVQFQLQDGESMLVAPGFHMPVDPTDVAAGQPSPTATSWLPSTPNPSCVKPPTPLGSPQNLQTRQSSPPLPPPPHLQQSTATQQPCLRR